MTVGIFGAVTGATGSIVFALANGRMTDVAGKAQYCRLFEMHANHSANATVLQDCVDIETQIAHAGMYYILPLLLIGFGQFLNGSFVEVSGTRLICRAQRMVFLAIMRQVRDTWLVGCGSRQDGMCCDALCLARWCAFGVCTAMFTHTHTHTYTHVIVPSRLL